MAKFLNDTGLKHLVEWIKDKLSGKSDTGHTHSDATQSASGFLSSTDKTKLDGIAAVGNAEVYSILRSSGDGTSAWSPIVATQGAQLGKGLTDGYGFAAIYYNGESAGGLDASPGYLYLKTNKNGKGAIGSGNYRFATAYINTVYGVCQVVKMGTSQVAQALPADRTKALLEFWKTITTSGSPPENRTIYDSVLVTELSSLMTAVSGQLISSSADYAFLYSISSAGAITPIGNFTKWRITWFN